MMTAINDGNVMELYLAVKCIYKNNNVYVNFTNQIFYQKKIRNLMSYNYGDYQLLSVFTLLIK